MTTRWLGLHQHEVRPLRLLPRRPQCARGDDACPFTAGYWWFLDRHRDTFAWNHRMARAVQGLDHLSDLHALVEQEDARGNRAP